MKCRAHGTKLRDWSDVTESSGGTNFDVTNVEVMSIGADTEHTDVGASGLTPRVAHGKPKTGKTPTFQAVDYDGTNPGISRRVLADRYLLGRQIGIGGYGAVFAAVDEHSGDRVAIKLLSPALSNDVETVTRFRREAIAASRVDHPGIVDVTDFHIDPGATSYIVMEYLDGEDLSETLEDEGTLEPARALSIIAQCAEALTAAHDSHILHRDLKPANIFLTTSARRTDVVKIIDFGISKITQGEGRFTDLTSASKVVGTPYYMSPEQAQGFKLDGRTDIYSLGVILFRMVTGERPFVGESALDILTQHIEAKRVAPSSVNSSLKQYPKLDRLILTAMSAKTRTRFASMSAFRLAIIDCLNTIDVSAAARLDQTQTVDRADTTLAEPRRDRAPTTLDSSPGEMTQQSLPLRAGMWRWGSVAVAAAAAATLAWWLTRSPTSPEEPTRASSTPTVERTDDVPAKLTATAPVKRATKRTAPRTTTRARTLAQKTPKKTVAKKTVAKKTVAKKAVAKKAVAKKTVATQPKVSKRTRVRPKRRTTNTRRLKRRKNSGKVGIKDW